MSNKLNQALDIFGEEITNEIVRQLRLADKEASGDLIKSIDTEVIKTTKGSQFRIIAEDYYKYVDDGRQPGKMPPIRAISRWVSHRGISQDAVWPIAKSIQQNGIRATNITDKTIREITRMKAYNDLEDDMRDWVSDAIGVFLENLEGAFLTK
jgi:hypothetical protein